ncbi:MAG: trimeric intracellular cation channel family protein [Thiolinea sp.]
MSFALFIQLLTLLATVTLAISGVLQAARSEMDFFGALTLACVCALGGGSLRDALIGATPVFWTTDLSYLATILPSTVLAIISVRYIPTGRGIRLRLLDVADAIGLALFAVLGAQKTLQLGLSEPVAVVMGVITGIAGGMIRDVLSQTVPVVLRGEIYASAALLGAITYTLLRLVTTEVVAILTGMSIVIIIRLAALYWRLSLPLVKQRHRDRL